jgi:hypothetical protein
MDGNEFYRQLRSLGLHGPMGEIMLRSGTQMLIYKMPDGSHKHISGDLTDAQRSDVIEELRRHLGVIENNRKLDDSDNS